MVDHLKSNYYIQFSSLELTATAYSTERMENFKLKKYAFNLRKLSPLPVRRFNDL